MERILEPEVMDTQDEAIAYDDMDHSSVNQAFVADLLQQAPLGREALDLGTGTARIPLLLVASDDEVRVHAVDLSAEMLDVARINVELSSYGERILLDRIDAKQLPFADNHFDVVMCNSIVHHIPEPAGTFAEAVRVCRPGGLLFFRDLSRPSSMTDVDALVQQYAGEESEHAQKMFGESLCAALTVPEVQAMVGPLGFDADTVQATSDRHWTWAARKPA